MIAGQESLSTVFRFIEASLATEVWKNLIRCSLKRQRSTSTPSPQIQMIAQAISIIGITTNTSAPPLAFSPPSIKTKCRASHAAKLWNAKMICLITQSKKQRVQWLETRCKKLVQREMDTLQLEFTISMENCGSLVRLISATEQLSMESMCTLLQCSIPTQLDAMVQLQIISSLETAPQGPKCAMVRV